MGLLKSYAGGLSMKKIEIIIGKERHVLVPDGSGEFVCEKQCSLYACCQDFGASTLCGSLQDVEDYEEGHFEKVPI